VSDHHEVKATIHETDEHFVASHTSTFTTFVVLLGLTVVALAVGFSEIGEWKVLLSLLIAGAQTAVLSYFFMDLRQADKLTWLIVGSAIFWTGLMFLFTLTDYLTRHLAVI